MLVQVPARSSYVFLCTKFTFSMSSDDDFDDLAYKAFEDQLYEEESLSGTDDDLDSEVEEVLYSQVHYASALVVSKNSAPGNETPKAGIVEDSVSVAQGQKCHLDSSVIEISSDDDDDNNDNGDDCIDNHGDVHHSSSFNYPEVVFCDENISAMVEGASKESSVVPNKVESGKIAENWDLDERDLQDSKTTNQPSRYYTPGKGLPHVKCYNCNEKGHLSQNCPQPKKISVCFLCGGVGHVKRYCPNELCFNCCETGHISKQCRKPRRRPYDCCNRCHVLGHIANDCPDRWRQYHLTTEVGPVIRPDKPVSRTSPVYCYNCGHQGHYGHECQEENASMRSELPFPFVVYYDGWGQMSSSRQKNKHKKQTPKHRSQDKQQYQAMSQGFYDQARQQDYDVDCRLFQPPPEKIRKTDDSSVRRVSFHDDSYETSAFNSPYADHTPKMDDNRDKRKKEPGRCEEENASVRSELPSPLAAHYDGWGQMSSSREKNKHKKQTPKHRSKNKQQYQAMSQGFYDQARQQDYDMDWRLSQPPPKKIRKTDDRDVRVSFHDDSYETSAFNSPYPDATPKMDNNRNETNKKPEGCERIVEILEPSSSHDRLIEEPYVFEKKKAKQRGKQPRHGGERSDNNLHGVNFNARNSSKQHNERRFSNPQRKDVYRSFEDRQFNSKRISSYPRKENNKFTSNRGFQFNNESRRKTYLKRYTF